MGKRQTEYSRQNIWTSTDVLQDAQVVGNGQNTEECRARIEQEMVDKGDAIELETFGNLMLNFDAFELAEELLPGKHAYDMVLGLSMAR